jgi:hypothetical protein
MRQRGFAVNTHKSYLGTVERLTRYFHQSPDQLQANQIQDYFVYLVQERGLSGATCRMYFNGSSVRLDNGANASNRRCYRWPITIWCLPCRMNSMAGCSCTMR